MKKNGFTLIEAIGVIVVIALIATVTLPIIINSNDRDRIAKQEKADIKVAVEYYINIHPELKNDLKNNEEIRIETSKLVSEGFITEVNTYKYAIVKYDENGVYDIRVERSNK